MKQLLLDRRLAFIKQVSEPMVAEHCVLVAARYSCMSACTDHLAPLQRVLLDHIPEKVKNLVRSVAFHGLEKTALLVKEKTQTDLTALGCSCSGVVVALGTGVQRLRVGDYVACTGVGFAYHAELIAVPEHCAVRLHDTAHLRVASMVTLGTLALDAIHRARLSLGEVVCVIGLGVVGSLVVQLAKRSGCYVIAYDPGMREPRVTSPAVTADVMTDSREEFLAQVAYWSQHYGADAAVVTPLLDGSSATELLSLCVRRAGRVVIMDQSLTVADVGLLCEKELQITLSSYGPLRTSYEGKEVYPYHLVRWTETRLMQLFVNLIAQQQIELEPLITQDINFVQASQAYGAIQQDHAQCVMVDYEISDADASSFPVSPEQTGEVRYTPAHQDRVRIGMIGVGECARARLLPIITDIEHASVTAVVDTNVSHLETVARMHKGAHALGDDRQLFEHDLVDMVVIASPHKFHCEQAIRALEQGKAVFVEKPCAVTHEQVEQLMKVVTAHPQVPFCVDYNRSFSPYMQKIKHALAKRVSPLIIHYRMNVGLLTQESLLTTEMGSGRIIGEACYVVDLFCYLTGSAPVSVSVEAMHTDDPLLFPTDNFSAHIRFHDGSLCSLMYTSIGHHKLGKERMELFFDSKSIVMDDYEYLAGNGFRRSFDEMRATPDEGHKALLSLFMTQVMAKDSTPLIPLERLRVGTHLTLIIDKLACQGGGTQEFTF